MSRNHTGEWIKLGRDLWTHPKVRRIAELLGQRWQPELPLLPAASTGQCTDNVRTNVLVHAVVSGLSRTFLTLNRHAYEAMDGTMDAVLTDIFTDTYVDDVSGLAGLQAAMIAVGWAEHDKTAGILRLLDYLKHNRLHKGQRRAGRPGNPNSAEAQRKREARQRVKVGQHADNAGGQNRTMRGQKPDNSTEQSRAEQNPSLNGFNGLAVGEESARHLDAMKKNIDDLRPESWGRFRHWSVPEETALIEAWSGLSVLNGQDWSLLQWFFHFCSRPTNREKWEKDTNVTSKRVAFLSDLASYHARANNLWQQAGRPKLNPGGRKAGGALPAGSPVDEIGRKLAEAAKQSPEEIAQRLREFREKLDHAGSLPPTSEKLNPQDK